MRSWRTEDRFRPARLARGPRVHATEARDLPAWSTVVLVVAVLAAGCSTPEEAPPEDAVPGDQATEHDVTAQRPEPVREELVTLLGALSDTVHAARSELEAAKGTEDGGAVGVGADEALDLLLDDPDTTAEEPTAVFPAVSAERESSGQQDDLLSALLSSAREAGGDLGRDAVETMRDPVAGDLGAWERDAEGMVAELRTTTAGVGDLDAAVEVVEGFQGDGTRALAWTMIAAGTTDAALARDAAERAVGHLGVVAVALSLLEEQTGTADGEPEAPDDVPDDAGPDGPAPEVPDEAPQAPPEPDEGHAPDEDDAGTDHGAEPDEEDGPGPDDVPEDLQPDDLPDPDAEPVAALAGEVAA